MGCDASPVRPSPRRRAVARLRVRRRRRPVRARVAGIRARGARVDRPGGRHDRLGRPHRGDVDLRRSRRRPTGIHPPARPLRHRGAHREAEAPGRSGQRRDGLGTAAGQGAVRGLLARGLRRFAPGAGSLHVRDQRECHRQGRRRAGRQGERGRGERPCRRRAPRRDALRHLRRAGTPHRARVVLRMAVAGGTDRAARPAPARRSAGADRGRHGARVPAPGPVLLGRRTGRRLRIGPDLGRVGYTLRQGLGGAPRAARCGGGAHPAHAAPARRTAHLVVRRRRGDGAGTRGDAGIGGAPDHGAVGRDRDPRRRGARARDGDLARWPRRSRLRATPTASASTRWRPDSRGSRSEPWP